MNFADCSRIALFSLFSALLLFFCSSGNCLWKYSVSSFILVFWYLSAVGNLQKLRLEFSQRIIKRLFEETKKIPNKGIIPDLMRKELSYKRPPTVMLGRLLLPFDYDDKIIQWDQEIYKVNSKYLLHMHFL